MAGYVAQMLDIDGVSSIMGRRQRCKATQSRKPSIKDEVNFTDLQAILMQEDRRNIVAPYAFS